MDTAYSLFNDCPYEANDLSVNYESYKELGLVCEKCCTPVYFRQEGCDGRKAHFAHFPGIDLDDLEKCELRVEAFNNATRRGSTEFKGQSLKKFQEHFLSLFSYVNSDFYEGVNKVEMTLFSLDFGGILTGTSSSIHIVIEKGLEICRNYYTKIYNINKKSNCKNKLKLIKLLCKESGNYLLEKLVYYTIFKCCKSYDNRDVLGNFCGCMVFPYFLLRIIDLTLTIHKYSYLKNIFGKDDHEMNYNFPKTCRSECCGKTVFHHTHKTNHLVWFSLFDSLKLPLKVHQCCEQNWEYREKRYKVEHPDKRYFHNPENQEIIKFFILIGAIRGMVSYVNEETVAKQMDLSVEQLKKWYGGFYNLSFAHNYSSHSIQGEHLWIDLKLTSQEAMYGCKKSISINRLEICQDCKGTGIEPNILIPICPTCGGTGEAHFTSKTAGGVFESVLDCSTCNAIIHPILKQGKCRFCRGKCRKELLDKFSITIPAGVGEATGLPVISKGNAGFHGGRPGNLYLYLSLKESSEIRENEDDDLWFFSASER